MFVLRFQVVCFWFLDFWVEFAISRCPFIEFSWSILIHVLWFCWVNLLLGLFFYVSCICNSLLIVFRFPCLFQSVFNLIVVLFCLKSLDSFVITNSVIPEFRFLYSCFCWARFCDRSWSSLVSNLLIIMLLFFIFCNQSVLVVRSSSFPTIAFFSSWFVIF